MLNKKVFVGEDEFGNKYYKNSKTRSVKYKNQQDPTTISASWHLWLHYAVDQVTTKKSAQWQKERQPNQTGTKLAYDPRSSQAKETHYIPWQPK